MRIGIIGSGKIGGTLARRFVDAGHEVALSNSRGPETLEDLVQELGPRARALSAAEAERFGELVVVSVPFGRYRELPTDSVAGKVVVDTNNYYPQRDGHFEGLDSERRPRASSCRRTFMVLAWSRRSTRFCGAVCVMTLVRQATPSGSASRSRATTRKQRKPSNS